MATALEAWKFSNWKTLHYREFAAVVVAAAAIEPVVVNVYPVPLFAAADVV